MQLYIQTFIVQAEPSVDQAGRAGYDVYYPDGRVQWMMAGDFEEHHRAIDRREKQIIDMNTAELEVLAISDKDYPPDS